MFPQPYHSGRGQSFGHSLILGGIYHAYYTIPHSLGASSYSYHSSLHTALSHHHTRAPAIIRDDGQAGATPRLTRYLTALQLHAIPILSLCYAYGISLPHAYAYVSTTAMPHTTHTAHTEPQRDHERHTASHGHGRHHHWHSVAQRPPESRSQRQAPPKGWGNILNFARGLATSSL